MTSLTEGRCAVSNRPVEVFENEKNHFIEHTIKRQNKTARSTYDLSLSLKNKHQMSKWDGGVRICAKLCYYPTMLSLQFECV